MPHARHCAQYHWPGNVRELKNAIERAYILCEQQLELQPMNIHGGGRVQLALRTMAATASACPIGSSLAQAERWLIEATLAHWAGNKNRAAKTLGCSLKTLYNKLAIYERAGYGSAWLQHVQRALEHPTTTTTSTGGFNHVKDTDS
jgi:two-component system response regulator HydG